MIKHFSKAKFHTFGWLAILLIAFLATGCATEELAPEVETQTEEQIETTAVETIDSTTPETGGQEEGWQIDEQETIQSSNFVENNPNVVEPIVVVEDTQGTVEDTVQDSTEEAHDKIEVMDLNDDVFVADGFNGQNGTQESMNQNDMSMDSNVFVADDHNNNTMENTADVFNTIEEHPEQIEEAKLLSFGDANEIEDVYFAFDSYGLDSKSQDMLRANAEWLKQNPNAQVEIQGHCDERGTNNYNLGLGERRALATRDFLIAQGVDSSRVHTLSYGEEKPFCFQSNENCWWQNRRAHFQISQ